MWSALVSNSCWRRTVLAIALSAILQSQASAQNWTKLPDVKQVLTVEGLQVTIITRPEMRFSEGPDKSTALSLRARVRLDDLQEKVPTLLHALATSKSTCATRWSFPELNPSAVQNGRLKVGGKVRIVQWLCAGPLKTILAQETARFVIALFPSHTDHEVAVTAELEEFDVGGGLVNSLGVDDEIKRTVSTLLAKAFSGDDAKFRFPHEVADLKPKFTSASVSDAGGGKGELLVEAAATVTPSDMTKFLTLFLK